MDDMSFIREKLRRESQEIVNVCDEAASSEEHSEEQKTADLKILAKIISIQFGTFREFMDTFKTREESSS